jgi:hypothetical protein
MELPRPYLRLARIGFACFAVLLGIAARAAGSGFTDGLSAEQKAASGITRLNAPQLAALNTLVDHDMTLARQGGVTGFSSEFAARHTPQELAAAGVDRLSVKERAVLNALAGQAIAMGPSPSQTFEYVPPPPTPPVETLVSAPLGLQVHGDVSFTVGGGHGSNFYGSSVDLFVTDPSGKFTLGIGVGEYRGKGLFWPYALSGPIYGPVYGPPPLLDP